MAYIFPKSKDFISFDGSLISSYHISLFIGLVIRKPLFISNFNTMKKFIKKLTFYGILLISVVVICVIINKIIISKNDLLSIDTHKKILILGASRTECAINDNLTLDAYNLSAAGDPLFYSYIKLKELKRINPSIEKIILSLDNRTLDSVMVTRFYRPVSLESKLPKFLQYMTLNDWEILYELNFYSVLKAAFMVPQYTARLIKRNIFKKYNKKYQLQIGGFKKINHKMNKDVLKSKNSVDNNSNYKMSSFEVENLFKIVNYCKENDLELIFINPPLHELMSKSQHYQYGRIEFKKFYDINFSNYLYLDYSDFYLPDESYSDLVHLNFNGANIFTEKLIKDSILKK